MFVSAEFIGGAARSQRSPLLLAYRWEKFPPFHAGEFLKNYTLVARFKC